MSTFKLCASMVTYYPDIPLLLQNIKTYIDHVDHIYIVDNTPIAKEHLKELADVDDKISISYNHKNLGIAQGLNLALKRALVDGFDWILTMDQDSSFENFLFYLNCFSQLEQKNKIAMTSTNIDYRQKEHFCHTQQRERVITSGSLLNLALAEDIGFFNEKLFIDEVDFDYCLQAKILGYQIIMFTHIPLNHTVGKPKKVSKRMITEHNDVRVYYMTRNRLYMASKYRKLFPKYYSYRKVIKEAVYKKAKQIIKYESNKWEKLKALYLGIKHFYKNRYGALK